MYHNNGPYELSPDLVERQLAALEKKYGGAEKAKEAALTIQRAFRRHSMGKKFAQMKTEKRISRRLENAASSSRFLSHHHHHHNHLIHTQVHQQQHLCPQQHSPNNYESSLYDGSEEGLPPTSTFYRSSSVGASSVGLILQNNAKEKRGIQRGGSSSSSSAENNSISSPKSQRSSNHHHYHHHHSNSNNTINNNSPQYLKRQQSGGVSSTPPPPPSSSSNNTFYEIDTSSMTNTNNNHINNNKSSFRGGGSSILCSNNIVTTSFGCNNTIVTSVDTSPSCNYTLNEVIRKRHYRTGLNIFNKKPEKGISYLIRRGFLENSPQAVARFLITRKGLSKQMIGEYLGNLTYSFNMAVLACFAGELDFTNLQIDVALRKFQTYFRMPGEAQKIERLMEIFSGRYLQCNPDIGSKLRSTDTIFILAFAIILLNTDLHTPNIKPEKRMKLDDFTKNLRNIDDGRDLDPEWLVGIYERIQGQEFKPGSDHVTQVMKVQQTIVAKCPNLALPHRRLVCYCRLYEVHDPLKKERPGIHQREVFLFNDILVITKIYSRKKNTVTYTFRQSYLLAGMMVSLFETQFYPYGIQVAQKWDRKVVLTLNARNEHDRSKFVEDLKESIAEMDEMETLRLEAELEKQRSNNSSNSGGGGGGDNRDSGINDPELTSPDCSATLGNTLRPCNSVLGGRNSSNGVVLRKSAINNSLLDLNDSSASDKLNRRGSVGSLDSGMSISFQSNSASSLAKHQRQQHSSSDRHHHHHHSHHHYHDPHEQHRMMYNARSSDRYCRTTTSFH
uniref:Putative LOC100863984 [Apis florea] n=1 Tax=Lepeophtheirus salmonis TaxID=72036 RepID=A0A0K2SYQ3_LEPSM